MFQSTPPHRGRPLAHYIPCCHTLFQSTPPHRGRLMLRINTEQTTKFQSTPPHRGRRTHGKKKTAMAMFQSTPPHRGRFALMHTMRNLDEPIKRIIHTTVQYLPFRCQSVFSPLLFNMYQRPLSGTEPKVLNPRQHEHIVITVHWFIAVLLLKHLSVGLTYLP